MMTLRDIAVAATAGPWMAKPDYSVKSLALGHWAVADASPCRRREANATFIATFSPDRVIALLDALGEVREAFDSVRVFVQDSIENGHLSGGDLGNMYGARDVTDAVLAKLREVMEEGNSSSNASRQALHGANLDAERSAHPDWHLCCETTEEMLSVGYVEADGSISHLLTSDEMRSIWFRMHAAIRGTAQ